MVMAPITALALKEPYRQVALTGVGERYYN